MLVTKNYLKIGLCSIFLYSPLVTAAPTPIKGIHFYHQDWELACDNTRTCRAAGYQLESSDDSSPVSVLLTRKAGANQPLIGEVKLGSTDYEAGQPVPKAVQLMVNQTNYGKVALSGDELHGDLSKQQTDVLVAALAGHTVIQFKSGDNQWNLSGQGAAAVLLKMDDIQGRVGTVGSSLRKGKNSESRVLPALPMPVVNLVKPVMTPALKKLAASVDLQQLKKELQAQQPKKDDDDCSIMNEQDDDIKFELTVQPLTTNQLLASGLCWRGAYNEGYGYWLINTKKPYQPKLITTSASDYSDGVITGGQKGRGLGDCWSQQEWVWNGQQFIHTLESTTGMCRMVQLGGAWELPTRVVQVKK